jgi:hypothetical protein
VPQDRDQAIEVYEAAKNMAEARGSEIGPLDLNEKGNTSSGGGFSWLAVGIFGLMAGTIGFAIYRHIQRRGGR